LSSSEQTFWNQFHMFFHVKGRCKYCNISYHVSVNTVFHFGTEGLRFTTDHDKKWWGHVPSVPSVPSLTGTYASVCPSLIPYTIMRTSQLSVCTPCLLTSTSGLSDTTQTFAELPALPCHLNVYTRVRYSVSNHKCTLNRRANTETQY